MDLIKQLKNVSVQIKDKKADYYITVYSTMMEKLVKPEEHFRDGPLFFIRGGYHFGTCRQFFIKSNAFQTIFFITFCSENNFLTIIF